MKIIFVNCSDYGSTGKIIGDISEYIYSLNENHEMLLCTPQIKGAEYKGLKKIKTSLKYEQGIYRRISYLLGMRYGFAPLSTFKIKKIIKKHLPDIVHIHCTNGYTVNVYSLLKFIRRKDIPTVITNHAEFFYTGNCPYAFDCDKWIHGCGKCPNLFFASDSKWLDRTHTAWLKMKKAISNYNKLCVASVSPWVLSRSLQSPIMEGVKQKCILNGIDTNTFMPSLNTENIRKKLGIDNSYKIIFHLTSGFSRKDKTMKGGYYLNELAKRFTNDKVFFIVAGKTFEESQSDNLKLLGQIFDQKELAMYYSAADLTVVTSRKETFGMAVAESLCCGTPIVGFKSGGSESVAIKEFTQFVDFPDVDELEKIIRNKWLNFKNSENNEEISLMAKKKYAREIMAGCYLDTYQEILDVY